MISQANYAYLAFSNVSVLPGPCGRETYMFFKKETPNAEDIDFSKKVNSQY